MVDTLTAAINETKKNFRDNNPEKISSDDIETIDKYSSLSKEEREEIEHDVRNSAYEIINRKGATAYGIGMCLTRITAAILADKNIILSVSSYDKDHNICISTPAIVNKDGVKEKIRIPLDEHETKLIKESMKVISDAIKSVE